MEIGTIGPAPFVVRPRKLTALGHERAESETVGFDTIPGLAYVVSVRSVDFGDESSPPMGQRPSLMVSGGRADGPLQRLGAIAGGRDEGRLEVLLPATSPQSRVEIRAPAVPGLWWGDIRLSVRERVDPNSGGPRRSHGDVIQTFSLYQDVRAGFVVPYGHEAFAPFEIDVPIDATRLTFATTHRGLIEQRNESTLGILEGSVGGMKSKNLWKSTNLWDQLDWQPFWDEFSFDVAEESRGKRIRLWFEQASVALVEDVIVTVPTFHCEEGARRPNLVLVSLDTTRRDHYGLYGYERDTTPVIDAFADEAVIFDDAVSTAPYTLPSHASMFSGQYPSTHGAVHPVHALDLETTPMLAAILADQGYATRAFTGGGYLSSDYGFAHGFDAFTNIDPIQDLVALQQASGRGNRDALAHIALHPGHGWHAALDWIDAHREVPFFLFLQTFAVHDYRPPTEFRERFVTPGARPVKPLRPLEKQMVTPYDAAQQRHLIDLYDAGLAWVDAEVGRLLARIEAAGLTDDTLVVITSDHGEAFGERGFNGHNQSVHHEQTRVPLILRIPGTETRRVRERVSLVDLAPTLLDLLGVEAPAAMQGRSLRPAWDAAAARAADGWTPSPALSEVDSNVTRARALTIGGLKYIEGDPQAGVTLPSRQAVMLYDLRTDPLETMNLAGDDPEAVAAAAAALEHLLAGLRGDASGGRPVELSEETRRQLIELGYLEDG